MNIRPLILALLSTAMLNSCSSTYVTPGKQADLSTFTDPKVKKAFEARPAIHFPADLALVHVQEGGYRSQSATGYGTGAYSVVTTRDVETDKDIDTLSKLHGVAGLATLNRLLLPKDLSSDLDLREAAAKLHTDAILVYTLATEFHDRDLASPLTSITLGLMPAAKHYTVTSTASAILMDTKTGYIYGALEEGDSHSGMAITWGDKESFDSARKKAERAAFDKLLASFQPFWNRVYNRYHH